MSSHETPANAYIVVRRFARQVRPYYGLLACILLLDLLTVPIALLLPVPLKLAVDSLTGDKSAARVAEYFLPSAWMKWNLTPLVFATVLLLLVYVIQHAVGFCNWLIRTYTGERLVLSFRSRLFGHAQRLSLSYHDCKGASDPAYRIQFDAPAIRDLVMNGFLPLTNAVVMLAGMIYVTVRLDWQIAVLAVAVAPVLFILSREYSRKLRDQWTGVRERDSLAMGVIQEVLSSVRVVKAFGQEQREHARFLTQSSTYMGGQIQLSLLQASFYVMVGLVVASASAAALFLGAKHVYAGTLTVGSLLLLMSYVAKLYEPLSTMSSKLVESQSAIVSLGRAFALLDEAPEVAERPGAHDARNVKGGIEFRNVTFSYEPEKAVLDRVSFRVAPGTHVGITGASGAGKSTILTLLTRLYDPAEGAVLLDGTDLRDLKIASLRDQFSIVLQEPVLFSTTIAENIAYARPEARMNEIVAAAKAAEAHDFIMQLPDGYDTKVGQRGATLSGGERQRISLARAFLKNAPVLIMDEPTSALDSQTEAEVVAATEALMAGRTTFVVAHRTSTLDHCDLVFHLEDGMLTVVADRRPQNYPAIVYISGRADIELQEPELVCAQATGD
ncbi:MAG TPA: ABC transporter ATP-binding protein [Terriglobales bacterium]|nr:ABC transporter ATP-binding protein [Terriglobales bacterium]